MKEATDALFLSQQRAEITEYQVYTRLSELCKDEKTKPF